MIAIVIAGACKFFYDTGLRDQKLADAHFKYNPSLTTANGTPVPEVDQANAALNRQACREGSEGDCIEASVQDAIQKNR